MNISLVQIFSYMPLAKGVLPRDIIHAATMVQNGLEIIVSVDKHYDVIEEVQRIAPSDLM
jgi:predicted nucleic acid-binding protein